MFVLDSHIPIPAKSHDGRNKYPFHTMEVGQSFVVEPKESEDQEGCSKRMRTSMGAAGRRLSRKFVIAPEGTGVRVWRSE